MELIKIEDLDGFVRQNVQVAILDEEGNDKAPFVHKEIIKTGLCPDGTHLRIYFDHMNFFAVPLTSSVEASESRWAALDQEAGLKYVIKKRA
ncbi:hypothetical protein [Cytobacillus firmus]|uniref:hypothetical protein n=1 Tax=Cytobacillus firmus TaxID=1399 RepID=UPI001C8DF400|nr:hypothetical protein [Cytobacillus firmus]MBX9974922.1 hypothetical protein [Cytobacillus firmus]MDM5224644.1 hypothetical protein [Cytobacillus sp. NJ13]